MGVFGLSLIGLALHFASAPQPETLLWLSYIALWCCGLFGVWLAYFHARWWLRLMLAPVAIGLTLGPWYWWNPLARPSTKQVARLRPPEIGDWPVVCELEGFYVSAPSSDWARTGGRLWVHSYRDSGTEKDHFLWNPETCDAPIATGIPADAKLGDGGPDGEALWGHSTGIHYSEPGLNTPRRLNPTDLPSRIEGAVFSGDREWAAWIYDTDPKVLVSPWKLTVAHLTGNSKVRTVQFELPEEFQRAGLLGFDGAKQEATLEVAYNQMAKIDMSGQWTQERFRPEGCGRISGSFRVHPLGWWFFDGAGKDCDMHWSINGISGSYIAANDVDSARWRWMGADSADIHRSGNLGAAVSATRGVHFSTPEAVVVFRLEDGKAFFRNHFPQGRSFGEAQVVFVGRDLLAVEQGARIRVFRIPDDVLTP